MNKLITALALGLSFSLAAQADDALDAKFQKSCSVCHTSGLLNAPKVGDKAAWAPRLKQGKAVLLEHAKNGFNQMPAKGTCADCSDEDLAKLIDKMSQ